MPGYMTVELTGLRFFARHGWHHQEAKTGNEFEVSVIASFDVEDAIITSIEQTINYAAVYKVVKTTFLVPEKLLETIAMKIAAGVKEQFPQLDQINVSIKKLTAPIENFTGTVGITYSKDYQ
jgi:7,8-dihydroneopterin aldolase/epimerase/oxygenase